MKVWLLIEPFEIFVEKIALNFTDAKIFTTIEINFIFIQIDILMFIQIKMRKYRDVLFLNLLGFIFSFRVFFIFKSTYRKLLNILKYFICLLISFLTLFSCIFILFFLYFINLFLNYLFLFQKALRFLNSRVDIRITFRFEWNILKKLINWVLFSIYLQGYFLRTNYGCLIIFYFRVSSHIIFFFYSQITFTF